MDESDRLPEVNVTFSERWWHVRGGFDFSAQNWLDPLLRTEQDRSMRRWLFEHFGDVGLGEADPQPRPNIEAYGHRFVPALFGCEIRYAEDQAPCEVPLHLDPEAMALLQVPNLETAEVARKARSDAGTLKKRYGSCDGGINYGGPLNAGLSIVGQELLAAFAIAPFAAAHVLGIIAQLIIRLHDELSALISPNLYDPKNRRLGLGNCPVIAISPQIYLEQVLPFDKCLRAQSAEFSLHHCGIISNYLAAYQQLAPLASVQPGWGSDIAAVRRTFPEARLSLLIECSALPRMSLEDLDEVVLQMLGEARPLALVQDIQIAYLGNDISDDYVRHIRTCHKRLQDKIRAFN